MTRLLTGGDDALKRLRDANRHRSERLEKGTGRHQIIIAMTARAMEGDRERAFCIGMDGYISKPIRAAKLYKEIEDVMRTAVMK